MAVNNYTLRAICEKAAYPFDSVWMEVAVVELLNQPLVRYLIKGFRKVKYGDVCLGATIHDFCQVVGGDE
jgi:hypothetical protein